MGDLLLIPRRDARIVQHVHGGNFVLDQIVDTREFRGGEGFWRLFVREPRVVKSFQRRHPVRWIPG